MKEGAKKAQGEAQKRAQNQNSSGYGNPPPNQFRHFTFFNFRTE